MALSMMIKHGDRGERGRNWEKTRSWVVVEKKAFEFVRKKDSSVNGSIWLIERSRSGVFSTPICEDGAAWIGVTLCSLDWGSVFLETGKYFRADWGCMAGVCRRNRWGYFWQVEIIYWQEDKSKIFCFPAGENGEGWKMAGRACLRLIPNELGQIATVMNDRTYRQKAPEPNRKNLRFAGGSSTSNVQRTSERKTKVSSSGEAALGKKTWRVRLIRRPQDNSDDSTKLQVQSEGPNPETKELTLSETKVAEIPEIILEDVDDQNLRASSTVNSRGNEGDVEATEFSEQLNQQKRLTYAQVLTSYFGLDSKTEDKLTADTEATRASRLSIHFEDHFQMLSRSPRRLRLGSNTHLSRNDKKEYRKFEGGTRGGPMCKTAHQKHGSSMKVNHREAEVLDIFDGDGESSEPSKGANWHDRLSYAEVVLAQSNALDKGYTPVRGLLVPLMRKGYSHGRHAKNFLERGE